jgi:hypothetical protein
MTTEKTTPTTAVPGQRRDDDPLVAGMRALGHEVRSMSAGALVEQAKGVLIFRYSINADTALSILELWADQAGVELPVLALALVHDICQGGDAGHSDPALVRWLEDRLRHDRPHVTLEVVSESIPVVVGVDRSYSALDALVAGTRDAARLGVPLEIHYDLDQSPLSRAQLMQRVDLAVELARAVEPGVVIRLASP